MMLGAAQLRYFAEMAEKLPLLEGDPGPAVPGAVEELPAARADRRLRPDHPVELPAHDGGVEARPGARTGNTVVLKPATDTPCSALELAKIIDETDLPKGVVNVIHGSGAECGEELCTSPLVDKVAFTGSTEVGRRISSSRPAPSRR